MGEGDATDPGLRASEAPQAGAAKALALELRDASFESVAVAVASLPAAAALDRCGALLAGMTGSRMRWRASAASPVLAIGRYS